MTIRWRATNVRFGHKAVVQVNTNATAALGCKADLKNAENQEFEGPESAQSGRLISQESGF